MAEVFSHYIIGVGDPLPKSLWIERTLVDEVLPKQKTKHLPSAAKMSYLPKEVAEQLQNKFLVLQQRSTWKDQCQIARWVLEQVTLGWHIFTLSDYGGVPFYVAMIQLIDKDHIEIKALWKSVHGMIMADVYGCGFEFLKTCIDELSPFLNANCLAYVTARKSFVNMCATNKVPLQMVEKLNKAQGASAPAQFYIRDL